MKRRSFLSSIFGGALAALLPVSARALPATEKRNCWLTPEMRAVAKATLEDRVEFYRQALSNGWMSRNEVADKEAAIYYRFNDTDARRV